MRISQHARFAVAFSVFLAACGHVSCEPTSSEPTPLTVSRWDADARGSGREYRFFHEETTGLTSFVLNGSEVAWEAARKAGRIEQEFAELTAIEFSEDSNPEALESFRRLTPHVFLPNSFGGDIVLVGVLDDRIQHTPSGPGRAESEPYRSFRLSHWYLRSPFIRWRHMPDPIDMEPHPEKDTQLQSDDFERGGVQGDLSQFVKPG